MPPKTKHNTENKVNSIVGNSFSSPPKKSLKKAPNPARMIAQRAIRIIA